MTELVAGNEISVDVLGFSNDLDSFNDKDEVITALDSSWLSSVIQKIK